jgi:uncharacterized protein (TIGR03083 family)
MTMGSRALRQYYDEDVRIEVDDELGPLIEPWLRHRQRFVERLGALSDDQWAAETRCDGWDARDVISHLITADGFWVVSLVGASAGAPTSYLADFDPTATPAALVEPMRAMPTSEVFQQFREGTDSFVDTVNRLDSEVWSATGESPLGQVSTRLVLAHAFWDSWLHERDIFVPLDLDQAAERDELALATWYALVMGAVQGGLLDDPNPTGPGLTEPLDVSLAFDDLPGLPLRLVVDREIRVERGGSDALPSGSALDLVETYTGRRAEPTNGTLPPALTAHLQRALQIL